MIEKVSYVFIALLLIIICVIYSPVAHARQFQPTKVSSNSALPIGTLKTIEMDDKEVVYCIDMHKQPAFDHPYLKNHTIQMKPSWHPKTKGEKSEFPRVRQSWHRKGEYCPNGTIPILSTHFTSSLANYQKKTKFAAPDDLSSAYHQHAAISANGAAIQGARATIKVWNPTVVGPSDFSLSQIWVIANSDQGLNTMEAGWHVFPQINGDSKTRIFIYWTSNGYQGKGCYDLKCPGFVQTNTQIAIGGDLAVSTYDGQQVELDINIQKDTSSGNWWLHLNGDTVGYWPSTLFTAFSKGADLVDWGGEVYESTGGGGQHSGNQMGSGQFPSAGYKRASYIKGIKYTDASGSEIEPTSDTLGQAVEAPQCYNIKLDNSGSELFLYYGGPGCQ